MSDYFRQNGSSLSFTSSSWIIEGEAEQRIKNKIVAAGVPLKDWNVRINYGIKTGCNEAFIISREVRDQIVQKSPKAEGIIRPILRGRDIDKYRANWPELYLIYIPWHFPLHHDSSILGASQKAESLFQKEYPVIYDHLVNYKKQLSSRNKAETGIRYEWYALQRWGANYMDDFSRPKIIYPNMTKFMPFYYDTEGFYTNQKCFIITGDRIAFLTAFFNSSVFKYCFKNNFPQLQGETRELSKIFFDKIPVIKVDDNQNKLFENLVLRIQNERRQNKNTVLLEKEVDALIFDLYGLNEQEQSAIGFIEIK